MGTIQKGILGGFSGKVGNVVGGSWKGIDYMRSLAQRRTATSSLRQKEQQMKFGLIARFQQPLANLLAISFKSYAIKMTGANSAMSYNIRNAITGIYPDYVIDYSKALVSRGDMQCHQSRSNCCCRRCGKLHLAEQCRFRKSAGH